MPKSKSSTSFWDNSVTHIQEVLDLRKQIDALHAKLNKLLGIAAPKGTRSKAKAPTAAPKTIKAAKRKTMSPEARAKISAAAKNRWAARKVPVAKAKPAPAKAPKKKGGITPEGRAKLAASMAARWKAKKEAAV